MKLSRKTIASLPADRWLKNDPKFSTSKKNKGTPEHGKHSGGKTRSRSGKKSPVEIQEEVKQEEAPVLPEVLTSEL